LACDSILSHEVVLPSGAIATASEDERPNVFKALKGAGSSNFGIATSFTLETIPLPNKDGLWIDYRTYSWDKVPALNKARTERMTSGVEEDVDFGGFDIFVHVGIYNMTLAITNHIHTSHLSISEYSDIFKQYGDIETLPDAASERIMPMSNITQEITALNPHGLRNTYATFTYKQIEPLEEEFIAIFEEGIEKIKGVAGIVAPVILQPIAKNTLKMMEKRGGNALGLRESDGPLVVYIVSFQWTDPADDELVTGVARDVVELSEAAAKAAGLWHRFKYINYAEDWQADSIYSG